MGRKVKNHKPEFKFQLVLESLQKGNVSEVAREHGINPNQLCLWRKEFLSNGAMVFEKSPEKQKKETARKITQLENIIGKKEVEISLLKNFLDFYAPLDGK